jgi:hypothetical protein
VKNPTKKFWGLTWVGWVNTVLLQWFGFRLAYGDRWRVIYGVLPLAGWFSSFGGEHYKRACKNRHIP